MNKYIDAEKLKAEIERELSAHDKVDHLEAFEVGKAWNKGHRNALKNILSFIDSLQQEQPVLPDNIDEAVEEYEDWVESYSQSDFPTCVSFRQAFKAGAEWMARQIKQEQSEPTCKTCGFYENNCPFIRDTFKPYPNKVCKDYTYSVMKEQEQPEDSKGKFVFPKFLYARTLDNKTIDVSYVPQSMDAIEYVRNDYVEEQSEVDLEEAAEEYEKKHTYQRYDGSGLTPEYDAMLAEAFNAEAEWQKEQRMRDAVEGEIQMQWDSFNHHLVEYGGERGEIVWLNWNSFEDVCRDLYELGKTAREEDSK